MTYDLTTVDIDIEERLIPINNDHMIDIYIYQRTDDEGLRPAMIYLHGGGWTAGDMRLYANQMKYIAELSHAVVIFPEYRLAPECPYPGPIDDAKGTIEYVVNHAKELRIDVDRLMVAGDSAGGGLTNSCLILDQKHDIKKAFEIYPAVDSRNYLEQNLILGHMMLIQLFQNKKNMQKVELIVFVKTCVDQSRIVYIYKEKLLLTIQLYLLCVLVMNN